MLATNLHDQAERLTVDQRSTDPAGTINDRDGDLMPPKHKSGKNDQTQKQRLCYPGNARLQHYKLGGQGLNRGDIVLNRYLGQHAVDERIGIGAGSKLRCSACRSPRISALSITGLRQPGK